MILTLYYMYSTLIQWWRLGNLRNKLNGTLNSHNSLLICTGNSITNSQNKPCLENLLFHNEDRIGCTILPKKKIDLSQWANFPKDFSYFPIYVNNCIINLKTPKIYLLIQAELSEYKRHSSEVIQVEQLGELIAWKAQENLELILRTDIYNLTKLVSCFSDHHLDINHDLKLLRVETVEIEGDPSKIRYDLQYPLEHRIKYSVAPAYWKRFVEEIKTLYSKVQESQNRNKTLDNPKITIEDLPENKHKSSTSKYHRLPKRETKNKLEVTTEKRTKSNERKLKKSEMNTPKSKVKKENRHQNGDVIKPAEVAVVPDVSVKNEIGTNNETKTTTLIQTKPPNVLVYAESSVAKDNVKNVLRTILNKEKYVLYDFPTNSNIQVWHDTTALLVVCGNVPRNLTTQFLQYLLSGGNLLCLCSDLLYSVLNIFATAEVRENELVRFSYENWKRVKMMHHVFCYQASPAKRQFSKDSDQSNNSSRGSSPVAPRTPSVVEIQHNGHKHIIQVQVLGAEETWQTPSLLLAFVPKSQGTAIFSQVHLEIDPTQYQDDENKYRALTESNQARLEIFKHILSQHLKMDCTITNSSSYSPAYFLGMHVLKQEMLSNCDNIHDNKILSDKITIEFYGKGIEHEPASDTFLPVLIHSCPTNFSTVKYFETLSTKEVGRLVIYADVLTSSQTILEKSLQHGLAVIVKQQTQGVGRGGNTWLSPLGCAMFSLQLNIPLDSFLGKALSLMQHLVMASIVSGIKSLEGYEDIELGLKWPNDLYANGNIKIGGLIVSTNVFANMAVLTIGCGVNLDNLKPTTCINEVIRKHNEKANTTLAPITYEEYFALAFNEIERIYFEVQNGNEDCFFELYYKYWLHSEAEVTVTTANGRTCKAKIIGIDDYGFLRIRSEDGSLSSVHPDGNTFDMMQGLIAPKVF